MKTVDCVKAIVCGVSPPSPGNPGEDWGEGLRVRPVFIADQKTSLTLSLSRRTGRGDKRQRSKLDNPANRASIPFSSLRLSFLAIQSSFLILLAIAGCSSSGKVSAPAATSDPLDAEYIPPPVTKLSDLAPPTGPGARRIVNAAGVQANNSPSDALPPPPVIDLSLYQFTAPAGLISGNKEFWKRVEEGTGGNSKIVDVATHDLLYKNGIRVGEGVVADWPRFAALFNAAGVTVVGSHFLAATANNEEFGQSNELPDQTLYYYDSHGLSGAVYDQCTNLFALSYQPSPQLGGVVRLELCPLVRAARTHVSYTELNDETSVDFVRDEHLYDLGLRVDLPPGKFLVVAPSEQSELELTIGHQFLTRDAKAGRREMVFIFVVNTPPIVHAAPAGQAAAK